MMPGERLTWLAAAAGATGLLYVLYRHSTSSRVKPFSLQQRRDAAEHKQAFVLAVNLRFGNMVQKQHFLDIWRPLADYVRAAEPGTLAFEVLEADNDPCNIMVYERYLSREAYEGSHRTSQAFHNFKAAMAALPFKVEVAGQSFVEQNLGFML